MKKNIIVKTIFLILNVKKNIKLKEKKTLLPFIKFDPYRIQKESCVNTSMLMMNPPFHTLVISFG